MADAVPWRVAWWRALYGPSGFYRQPSGPAGHFSTATHGPSGRLLADAIWRWADLLGVDAIIDLGAGRGELLRHLYAASPGRPLTGLDVVGRPQRLPDDVGWVVSPGGGDLPEEWPAQPALVVAHEWLDVVPCELGQVASDGSLRQVLVDPATGEESLGDHLQDADLQWCQRFWPSALAPSAEPGDRVEVGRQRDDAWLRLLDRLGGGPALAVDYGHLTSSRPRKGTFTAYRAGQVVDLVPDGSCDLTAHVAVDSLRHARLLSQRDALDEVGVTSEVPDHALARTDPATYLDAVAQRSVAAWLRGRGGLGDFWWVVSSG